MQSNASAALLPPTLSFTTFAGPKYRKPKMGPHDLRAWSFEDGCLCSILHGLLQLQIWTAFLLPARLFSTVARQSATQRFHTTFSQLSEPTQGSSSTCTLLFPFPARFSALHCSPHLHKRVIVALTLKRRPPLYCTVAPNLFGWDVDMLVPDDKPSTIRTAEHFRQYRQQLARKGVIRLFLVEVSGIC